jgi:hypothetical protein
VWQYEGQELPNIGLNAVSGRPPEEYGIEPTAFGEMRRGCYDIDARVADMNANGVLGSMCFPSFPQFCGQLFARTEDKDQALALVQAYRLASTSGAARLGGSSPRAATTGTRPGRRVGAWRRRGAGP